MSTWAQLGIHRKPLGLLNVAGYFDHLVKFVDHAVGEGFVPAAGRRLLMVGEDPDALLDQLAAYEAPAGPAWITASEA